MRGRISEVERKGRQGWKWEIGNQKRDPKREKEKLGNVSYYLLTIFKILLWGFLEWITHLSRSSRPHWNLSRIG